MTEIEKYYNKFNESHRLTTRHGRVEFEVSLFHILRLLKEEKAEKILDLGAGTGRYSLELFNRGYDVTAVELVKKNFDQIRALHKNIKCFNSDARNLKMLPDDSFDATIMFGPLYHLHGKDKLTALKEASRVTKKDGLIFCAHLMNEYAVLKYCFEKNKIHDCIKEKTVSEDFKCADTEGELYSYIRLEDAASLAQSAGLERVLTFSPDGASDYMRRELNAMDEETFALFVEYQKKTSTRPELLGAGSHIVDVLRNSKHYR